MATQPNWWEDAPLAPASDPSFTGFIPGVPKPKDPPAPKSPVFVPKDATRMFDPNTGTYSDVPQTPDQKDALKDAIGNLGVDELLQSISRARGNLKTGWASGTWGAIAELKPGGGTPRDDFLANLNSVKGSVTMEKLQALKDASKTGASGMGALSEKEGERLASSLAALSDNMSPQAYEESFKTIARHAYTLQAVRDGLDPNTPRAKSKIESSVNALFDPKDVTAPGGATAPSGGGRGGPPPPGAGELTPEQQKADRAFLSANPGASPDQYAKFLQELTGEPQDLAGTAKRLEAVKAGGSYSGAIDRTAALQARIDAENKAGLGESDAGALAAQGRTFNLSDEAAGIGNVGANAILAPFSSKVDFNPIEAYQFGRDAERLRIDNARRQLGYGGTAIELASGLTSLNPAGALASLTAHEGALGGAAASALAGFGAGEGAGQSTAGAGVGALAGYGLGRALPAATNLLPRRLRGPQGMAPDIAAAAQAEDVNLIRPMVDPKSRTEFSALEGKEFSQPIIRSGVERTRQDLGAATERLGQGGVPLEPGVAGEIPQRAGNRFIQRSRDIKNRLYTRAENLGGTAQVQAKEALGQIDQELAQLGEAPDTNAGEIKFLEGLKSDLSRPQTVGSIRRIRTSLRGQINQQNLTMTSAEARALRVMDAAKQDIGRDAPPAAASAYARADAFNRERQTYIDDVLKHFLGPRDKPLSAEKAFDKIKAMASPGGDGRRLAAMMRNLEPDERQDIAATIAHNLGREAPDMPFSAQRFITMTSRLSPSARRTIFGPDGAQSIQNLRTLSQALRAAGQDINQSRSGTLLERAGWRRAAYGFISSLTGLGGGAAMAGGGGAVGGAVAGATVAGAAMGASALKRTLSARAMVNPRVSMWLADAANVGSKAQAQQSLKRLGTIIAREPAIANELQPVYSFLEQRLTQPLAAQPGAEGQQNDQ